MVQSRGAMSFTNCQAIKKAYKKVNCLTVKLCRNKKIVSKIMVQSRVTMSFTNCQALKKACKKVNCRNSKRCRNKKQFLKLWFKVEPQ
jgi:hypothetical protein